MIDPEYITDHFKRGELECPDCHELVEDELFRRHVLLLEEMRAEADFPIIVNSGHRCPKHNAAVGGSPDSMHLKFATDICPESRKLHDLKILYRIALKQKWGGIGMYDTWLHLDLRDKQAHWNNAIQTWWV